MKKKPAENKNAHTHTTVITMVVDESYSMLPLVDATINGFNEYVETVRKTIKGNSYFSALCFDTRGIRKLQVGAPLETAIKLTRQNYEPTGGTPLLDAMMSAIEATDEVARKYLPAKPIVVVQTDGEENSSRTATLDMVQQAIKRRQEMGWQFVFIGAGINAFNDAVKFGIDVRNTMSYRPDVHHTGVIFGQMAQNTVAYARGMSNNMSFTACQSADAGEDPHITLKKMGGAVASTKPLDLTKEA